MSRRNLCQVRALLRAITLSVASDPAKGTTGAAAAGLSELARSLQVLGGAFAAGIDDLPAVERSLPVLAGEHLALLGPQFEGGVVAAIGEALYLAQCVDTPPSN